MAINHADGSTLSALVATPIVAGFAAANASAGWLTFIIMPLGILIGIVIALAVHFIAYRILDFGIAQSKAWLAFPVLVAYMLIPPLLMALGFAGVWFGAFWLVKHWS